MTGMSVLGETHLAAFTDMRTSLLGGTVGLYPPGLSGLGHSSMLPLPLWRPSTTPLPPMWCSSPNCPCNLSRPGYYPSDMADYMMPRSWEASTWPSWYLKMAGKYPGTVITCSCDSRSLGQDKFKTTFLDKKCPCQL